MIETKGVLSLVKVTTDKDIDALRKNFIYAEGNLYRVMKFRKPCAPYLPYSKKNNAGYYSVRISRAKKVGLHVAIWAYHNGKWPENEIDHEDQDKDNYRIENLREATRVENSWNVGITRQNTSGTKNVAFHKASGKWRVYFQIDGKQACFGLYKNKEDAVRVAVDKRKEVYV